MQFRIPCKDCKQKYHNIRDMILHSTNGKAPKVSFSEGISNGLAPDGGLYMPDSFPVLPLAIFRNIREMGLKDIAYVICSTLFGKYLSPVDVKKIVDDALTFDIPLRRLDDNKHILELYHGPTCSFKDVGARFMAHILPLLDTGRNTRNVILATSGDSGGAVADAFSRSANTNVFIVYPKNELTAQQIAQFATRGNVHALEVNGTFDDCQAMVKEVLRLDAEKNSHRLTSGNSINLARELPSIIYFFHAYARALETDKSGNKKSDVVIAVPCGNLGGLAAALMAKQMGLPVNRFIAANNANDAFVEYLKTGGFKPRKTLITLARAMDVGNPSNIARIIDLYGGDLDRLRQDVTAYAYTDHEIADTIRQMYTSHGILLDPQGATAVRAVNRHVNGSEIGVALASAHPAKFSDAVNQVLGVIPPLPESLSNISRRNIRCRTTAIAPTPEALMRILKSYI